METEIEIQVRSTEIDILGHVGNSKYLDYIEWGRDDWYEKAGFSSDRLALEMDIGTVMVNININYRREARQGEILLVRTKPVRKGVSSYVLHQKIIRKSNGDLVADAEVTSVTMCLTQRRSVPLPAELAQQFPK
ncbi:MAG: acyl-CoA thioesterase [Bacillota bacterium]|nr:acyl-CoA thioesterase [Bacillota bacterium]